MTKLYSLKATTSIINVVNTMKEKILPLSIGSENGLKKIERFFCVTNFSQLILINISKEINSKKEKDLELFKTLEKEFFNKKDDDNVWFSSEKFDNNNNYRDAIIIQLPPLCPKSVSEHMLNANAYVDEISELLSGGDNEGNESHMAGIQSILFIKGRYDLLVNAISKYNKN